VDLANLLGEAGVEVEWSDKTYSGRHIEVAFTGLLREDQELATDAMLKHDCGVLAAATAFGKTVIAAKLAIAEELALPLARLPREARAFIDQVLSETLVRPHVLQRIRHYFRTQARPQGVPDHAG